MEREEYLKVRDRLTSDFSAYVNAFNEDIENRTAVVRSNFCNMSYLQVVGVNEEEHASKVDVINALGMLEIEFSYVLSFVRGKLNIYIGCDTDKVNVVEGILTRSWGATISMIEVGAMFNRSYKYGVALIGDIAEKDYKEGEKNDTPIDQIMALSFKDDFAIVISCVPLSEKVTRDYLGVWEDLKNQLEKLRSRPTTIRDERETTSISDVNSTLERYNSVVECNIKKFSAALLSGLFNCTIKLYSDEKSINDIVAGIFRANSKNEDLCFSLHKHDLNPNEPYNDDAFLNMREVNIGNKVFREPVFSNLYSGEEMDFFVRFPKTDIIGCERHIVPGFSVSRGFTEGIHIGNILRNNSPVAEYCLPEIDLNRHMLVCGMTGSGKTNTVMNILKELYKKGIAWSCIEPAKREYFHIYKYGIEDLEVFEAGGSNNRVYINPFQPFDDKVPLQTHIDSLYEAFMSCYSWVSPLPYVLENSIYRAYEICGYKLDGKDNERELKYPTIELLYTIIPEVVSEMGYEGRLEYEVKSSLQARISTLRRGEKGRILNVASSMNMKNLFTGHNVIELENIGDNSVKSLIMSLLMTNLREYRMTQEDSQLEVRHYLLIEEAHRLLRNTEKGQIGDGDAQSNGVKYFTDMINELRSKGQGFIIADQSPEQLASAVIKNTNLKICHRLVSKYDKELIGDSMAASETQIKYLSNLKRGEAEVYSEGDDGPKLVRIPDVRMNKINERILLDREEIIGRSRIVENSIKKNEYGKSIFCLMCGRNDCEAGKVLDMISNWSERFGKVNSDEEFKDFVFFIAESLKRENRLDSIYCVMYRIFMDNEIPSAKYVSYFFRIIDYLQAE